MFTATLTVTKRRKQPKCPSTNKWVTKFDMFTQWNKFSQKKEMNEVMIPTLWTKPWKYYLEWKEPSQKDHILHDST